MTSRSFLFLFIIIFTLDVTQGIAQDKQAIALVNKISAEPQRLIESKNFKAIGASEVERKASQLIDYEYNNKHILYVDATLGNDHNKGASKQKPWKTLGKVNSVDFNAGDIILFKCGEIWNGQLYPQGSGSTKAPIVFSSYGSGKKPMLDGKGLVDQVIRLEDVGNIEMSNLEITNNSGTIGNRLGILIKNNGNFQKHIYLNNLYIHDIMGDYSFGAGKSTGGIGIMGTTGTKLDDIKIEDCEIANVSRVGIYSNITGPDEGRGRRPITNFIIRRNKIHHCAGDGVIVRHAFRPLIEYNTVYENHNFSEDEVKYGVALWCRSTDEAIFQYNEIYNTRGGKDGESFDADEDAYRTVFQYNYSHDNEGGFVLITSSSEDAIVRYNLSVNDGIKGLHVFDFPVWYQHVRGTAIVHNNTIVLAAGSNAVMVDEALPTSILYNNIFFNNGTGALSVKSKGATAQFKNNSYYGYALQSFIDSTALIGDPQLVSPYNYSANKSNPFNTGGFVLKTKSPCLGRGVPIETMAGNYWLTKAETDLWGNPLKGVPLSIGASQN